jgi:hypothetical protein
VLIWTQKITISFILWDAIINIPQCVPCLNTVLCSFFCLKDLTGQLWNNISETLLNIFCKYISYEAMGLSMFSSVWPKTDETWTNEEPDKNFLGLFRYSSRDMCYIINPNTSSEITKVHNYPSGMFCRMVCPIPISSSLHHTHITKRQHEHWS